MLKTLLTPLLALVLLSSGSYYTLSARAARPATVVQTTQPSSTAGVVPAQSPPPTVPLQPQPKLKDVDAILVIDNSGSMFGYTCRNREPIGANDAEGLRIQGAEIIIGALAADLKPRETKLGIVTFGNDARLVRELTQLDNEDATVRSGLVAAIQNPQCQGETNIVAAMRAAQGELRSQRANPNNIPAIIFLTDGTPTVGGGEDEISRLLDELGDVRFFTIILGQSPNLDQFKRFWQQQAAEHQHVSVYELNSNDEIPALYKQIAADLNNTPDLVNVPTLPPGATVQVPIPANVQQAVLTVLKPSASVQMRVQDPDGNDLQQLPPSRFRALSQNSSVEVLVVERPAAGDWTVRAPGGETLIVLKPEFKSIYEVQLLSPDSQGLLSVDQPTDLVVQVIDGEQQTPLAGAFTFAASYRSESESADAAHSITLQPAADNPQHYQVQVPADTFGDAQRYRFSFAVEDDAGLRSVPSEYLLTAGQLPALTGLTATSLRVHVNEPVALQATIAHVDSVQGQVVPRFLQPLPGGAQPAFTSDDNTTFRTTLPPFGRPGSYSLAVTYSGKTVTARDFNSTRSLTIVVVEPTRTILLRYLALVLTLVLGCYFGFRYLLLRPLIPLFQRVGISPQGYIRIQPPNQPFPDPEQSIAAVLRSQRRLRSISIGPSADIPLTLPDAPSSDSPDDDTPPPRTSWRERLFGKRALGKIGRSLSGLTFIRTTNGAPRQFSNGSNLIEIAENQIEYSLTSLDNLGDDNES